jgi:hypothetical protein
MSSDRQLRQHRISWHLIKRRGTTLLQSVWMSRRRAIVALVYHPQVSDAVELRLVPVESETGVVLYSPLDTPHPRGEIVVRRKDGARTSYWNRPDLDAEK